MGPGDVIAMLGTLGILFVVFPVVLMHGIARVKAAKAKGGDALRMSELKAMIDEQVAYATAPLRARIEVLEEIATAREEDIKLLNAPSAPRLDLPEREEAVAVPRARGRA